MGCSTWNSFYVAYMKRTKCGDNNYAGNGRKPIRLRWKNRSKLTFTVVTDVFTNQLKFFRCNMLTKCIQP